ncbi:MAG: cupin domain-containing protein [bacterium]|nr:cupin domain-containing protein [bacterium]
MENYFAAFKSMKGKTPLEGILLKSVHLNNVMITWVEFQPNTLLPEHSHEHEQITLVVEGKLEMTVGGTKKILEKGETAVIPSNTKHSAQSLDEVTIAVDAWNPIREDYKME